MLIPESLKQELMVHKDVIIANGVPDDKFKVLAAFMENLAFHNSVCPQVTWLLTVDQAVFVDSVMLHRYIIK